MGGGQSRNDEWEEEEAARREQEEEDQEAVARRDREEAARRAQEEAEHRANEARRQAEEEQARARHMQAEAQRLAAEAVLAANEARAIREAAEAAARSAQEEAARRALEEAARRAREEAVRQAQEEATRKAQEDARRLKMAEKDAHNARMATIEAENRANALKREAEAAEAEAREAKARQAEEKRLADEAEKAAKEEKAPKDKAERDLKEGMQPIERPTQQELDRARTSHQYTEGLFHVAVAGVSGAGKSSLINAFRGIPNNHPRAASTGIVETTATVARYPDPNPKNPLVLYDVPGAGTLDIPDWQYFNNQGLYVFDCIIVLFDNRFTATDVAILRNCQRFNISSYLVRSKSNQHIENVMKDLGYDSDEEEDEEEDPDDKPEPPAELVSRARQTFIDATKNSVKANLEKASLSPQRVYIVSKDAMLATVTGKKAMTAVIDEDELLRDLMTERKLKYPA